MTQADQLDEVIMKYIFMRPDVNENEVRQYSLVGSVNDDLVLESIPQISYKAFEAAWQKLYKGKSGAMSSRPVVENPPQAVSVKQNTQMSQRRMKRAS